MQNHLIESKLNNPIDMLQRVMQVADLLSAKDILKLSDDQVCVATTQESQSDVQ
jgi:hypothetical protein